MQAGKRVTNNYSKASKYKINPDRSNQVVQMNVSELWK